MSTSFRSIKAISIKESAWFIGLLFVGFVLMPIAIYLVVQVVFGAYAAATYGTVMATAAKRANFQTWSPPATARLLPQKRVSAETRMS